MKGDVAFFKLRDGAIIGRFIIAPSLSFVVLINFRVTYGAGKIDILIHRGDIKKK